MDEIGHHSSVCAEQLKAALSREVLKANLSFPTSRRQKIIAFQIFSCPCRPISSYVKHEYRCIAKKVQNCKKSADLSMNKISRLEGFAPVTSEMERIRQKKIVNPDLERRSFRLKLEILESGFLQRSRAHVLCCNGVQGFQMLSMLTKAAVESLITM